MRDMCGIRHPQIFVVFENIKLLQEYYKTIRLWKINLHNKNYSIHSKKKEKSPIYRKMEDLQNLH